MPDGDSKGKYVRRQRNREERRKYQQEYRKKHPEKQKAIEAKSRNKYRERIKINGRFRYVHNREAILAKSKQRRDANREMVFAEKAARGCMRCGESDPVCLDFHHRDPEHKLFNVSGMASCTNVELIKEEMAKCDVICSNCHRKLHHEQNEPFHRSNGVLSKEAELAHDMPLFCGVT